MGCSSSKKSEALTKKSANSSAAGLILRLMQKFLLFFLLMASGYWALAQKSDYLQIQTRKGTPMKTYYAGGFISAETWDGFKISGYITAIRNDSILILQEETRLMGTEFGSRVDTLRYPVGLYYNQIKKFNFGSGYVGAKKKGFSSVTVPGLMVVGGVGFGTLQLVNMAYRGESFNQYNNLATIGISYGVAGAGLLWKHIKTKRNKVGGKYKAVYIRSNS